MEAIDIIALTLGVAWASGINLYAAILVLGWLGGSGDVTLPPGLEVLSDPKVMVAAGVMYCVEFFADKTPGVDSGWDALHTFIRIPAGAMLAATAAEGLDMGQASELIALLVGGGLATTSHATKAGSRLLINTSPEPVTNWTASVTEDIAVIGGLWTALNHPVWFLIALAIFLLAVVWLLPKIWRALRRLAGAIGRWFRGRSGPAEPPADHAAGFNERRQDFLQSLYQDPPPRDKS